MESNEVVHSYQLSKHFIRENLSVLKCLPE